MSIASWPSMIGWHSTLSRHFRLYDFLHCLAFSGWMISYTALLGLSPNFHIHVSVSDLCISRIGPHIFLQQNRPTNHGNNKSLTDTWMWKLGLLAAQFFFWGYLFRIFSIVSLQCVWHAVCWMISLLCLALSEWMSFYSISQFRFVSP